MNIEEFHVIDGHATVGNLQVPLSRATIEALAKEGANTVTLGFRPESLDIVPAGEGFPVLVNVVEELGSDAFLYGTLEGTVGELEGHQIIARVDPRRPPMKGELVYLQVREGEQHVFSSRTGQRLPA